MASDDVVIERTRHWIQSFIIGLNLCPFAKRTVDMGSLKLQVTNVTKLQQALEALMLEFQFLDTHLETETTILIFPLLFKDFFGFLDFVNLAERLLNAQHYEGIYQLATFHPDYCFADVDMDDVSNYTNRSPYPMLHILREESIEKAIEYYGDTESIPEHNIALMNKLGIEKIQALSVIESD